MKASATCWIRRSSSTLATRRALAARLMDGGRRSTAENITLSNTVALDCDVIIIIIINIVK
jgi:hypothetical protein